MRIILFLASMFIAQVASAHVGFLPWSGPDVLQLIRETALTASEIDRQNFLQKLIGPPGATRPDLLEVSSGEKHEMVSIRRIAHALHELYGYTLVFMAESDGVIVPGFDGLVVSQQGEIVANFSLKSKLGLNRRQYFNTLEESVAGLSKFSQAENWGKFLVNKYSRNSAQREGRQVLVFQNQEQLDKFKKELATIRKLTVLFGIGQNRPNWILYDLDPGIHFQLEHAREAARLTISDSKEVAFADQIFVLGTAIGGNPSNRLLILKDGQAQIKRVPRMCNGVFAEPA